MNYTKGELIEQQLDKISKRVGVPVLSKRKALFSTERKDTKTA
jgi:hypothetical protein